MSRRARVRRSGARTLYVLIGALVLAGSLAVMAGSAVATPGPECSATVHLDGAAFDTAEELLEAVGATYSTSSRESGPSQETEATITALVASAQRTADTGDGMTYRGETAEGSGEISLSKSDDGWRVDEIWVAVSATTCATLIERAESRAR